MQSDTDLFCLKNSSSNEVSDFYASWNKLGYLTPLQRKKLRIKNLNQTSGPDPASYICVSNARCHVSKNKQRSKAKNFTNVISKRGKVQDNVSVKINKMSSIVNTPKKFFLNRSTSSFKTNFTISLWKKNINLKFKDKENKSKNSCNNDLKITTNSNKHLIERTHLRQKPIFSNELLNDTLIISNKQHNIVDPKNATHDLDKNLDWPLDIREQSAFQNSQIEENIDCSEKMDTKEKSNERMYQIFVKSNTQNQESKTRKTFNKKQQCLFAASVKGKEQLIIDAGQKSLAPKVCLVCNFMYASGDNEDEKLHIKHHNLESSNLKFLGWKNENILAEFEDGKCIMIKSTDQSFMLKKVEGVLKFINKELGMNDIKFPSSLDSIILLFVSIKKLIIGCLVAERITKAYPVFLKQSKSDEKFGNKIICYSSNQETKAICGINRIWVDSNYRRQKVASRMVNCLRMNYIYGCVLDVKQIAFSAPTLSGQKFASAYTGNENFLVYNLF